MTTDVDRGCDAFIPEMGFGAEPDRCTVCGDCGDGHTIRLLVDENKLLREKRDQACFNASQLLNTLKKANTERDALFAERRRDALDGQAALDEVNNEVVRVRAERDVLARRWAKMRVLLDDYSDVEDGTDGPRPNMAMRILNEADELEIRQ
jgi:uncharacterized coiled-coil DUF342 family protein